jgi:hypothetical protein
MAFAYQDEVDYVTRMRPDHVKIAGEDCLRVGRVVDSALGSLEQLRGHIQWDGGGSGLYEQRLAEACELATDLRAGYVQAGNALLDYLEGYGRVRELFGAGSETEKILGLLIHPIAKTQSPTVQGSAPMRQWTDLRGTQGFLDWWAESGQRDAIDKVRDEAERCFQRAGSLYGQAREAERSARASAVAELDRARRALPDFLANSSNALAIIRDAPGLRDEVYEASKDPNARRPVGTLEEYQVESDNRPTVLYPNGLNQAVNDIFGNGTQRYIIASEAEMLDELGLVKLKRFQEIQEMAEAEARERFPNSSDYTDDQADAFRHTYWNALLTKEFGEDWAAEFTSAHERNPANNSIPEAMDLHNNSIGRALAMGNPDASDDALADLVGQAVADGRTVVIDGGGNLVYSDQVRLEETIAKTEDLPPTNLPGGPAPHRPEGGY